MQIENENKNEKKKPQIVSQKCYKVQNIVT